MRYFNGDECPLCGKLSMPQWNQDPKSAETARMCSNETCRYIEPKAKPKDAPK